MRILLTGAGGFIGGATLAELRARGHHVIRLLRAPSAGSDDPGEETLFGDLLEPAAWAPRLKSWRPEACVHAAWFTDPATYLNSTENVWMMAAGLDLVDALSAAGCRQCVLLGTCAEYDTAEAEILREESPLRPATLYASCKVAFSLLARKRAQAAGMRLAWARLFHPYGPRERPQRLVASACRTLAEGRPFAVRNPSARRDFIHVDDVARAIADLVEAGADGSFNVATGRSTSVSEAIALIGAASGRGNLVSVERRPRQDWDPDAVWGSSDLLTATTGWTPRIPLDAGLASTYAWWAGRLGSRD